MKDYTIRDFEKKDFILRYEIVSEEKDKLLNKKIIIEYASGRLYETAYTKEIEKDILKKMKEQVEISTTVFKNKKFVNKIGFLVWGLFVALISVLELMELISFMSVLAISGGSLLIKILIDIPSNRLIKDYDKNLLFVNNMELFQNGINKDMGMYLDLNKKSMNFIEEIVAKKEQQKSSTCIKDEDAILREPTINTIDDVSPKVIDDIYDLLVRNEEFSKYYDNTTKSDNNVKKRTLTKNS